MGTDRTFHFKGIKRSFWEGGHRVPYIVRWPKKTPDGSSCSETICLNDFMATAAENAGVNLAKNPVEYRLVMADTGQKLGLHGR